MSTPDCIVNSGIAYKLHFKTWERLGSGLEVSILNLVFAYASSVCIYLDLLQVCLWGVSRGV